VSRPLFVRSAMALWRGRPRRRPIAFTRLRALHGSRRVTGTVADTFPQERSELESCDSAHGVAPRPSMRDASSEISRAIERLGVNPMASVQVRKDIGRQALHLPALLVNVSAQRVEQDHFGTGVFYLT
jgi:hypothetical protein